MRKILTLLLPLIIYIPFCQSATFCATTSAELQSALDAANTNNQHNVIRIAEGSYDTSGSQFSYNESDSNAGWDLEISGGWSSFFLNPCGQQFTGNPFSTILSGLGNNRVLRINAKGVADITISNIFFFDGAVGNSSRGGGLEVTSNSQDNTGIVKIERNVFGVNEADFGSAMYISGFDTMRIKNNLYVSNHALTGHTVSLIQNDNVGIYFTNNTVVSNSNDNTSFGAGASISVSGSSNAAIYNNILWGNDNSDLRLASSGQYYLVNNNIGLRIGVTPFSNTGNISLDPLFIPGILSYTPAANSPLVDAGKNSPTIIVVPTPFNNSWSLGLVDLLGNIRKQGNRVDIGAYESTPEFIFDDGFE